MTCKVYASKCTSKELYHFVSVPLTTTATTTTTTVFWPSTQVSRYQRNSFTHLHLSLSSTILNQFPPSTVSLSILPVQITCLTVLLHNLSPSPFGLPLSLEPSSYSIHFFTQSLSYFRNVLILLQPVLL